MFRRSPWFRRLVIGAAFLPAVALTARGAQAPPDSQMPSGGAGKIFCAPSDR
jgi:hypothetical protein